MNYVAIIVAVFQIVPALIDVLKAIEVAIPGSGKGEAKIAAVREMIEASHEKAATLWPILEKVINILVSTFNKTGVFTKTPAV